MPDKEIHLKKSADNEHLASILDLTVSSAPNWAITMTFYAALHLVEAYFFTQGKDMDVHLNREIEIKRDTNIKGAWRPYERLKTASEYARYEDYFYTGAQYGRIRENLEDIKAVVLKHL